MFAHDLKQFRAKAHDFLLGQKKPLPTPDIARRLFGARRHEMPETQVVVTIVSGVLSPLFLNNPINHLLRGVRDPLAIAEVSQIITQMVLKKRFRMNPQISFDLPQTVDKLRRDYESIYQAVISKANHLMNDHLLRYHPLSK